MPAETFSKFVRRKMERLRASIRVTGRIYCHRERESVSAAQVSKKPERPEPLIGKALFIQAFGTSFLPDGDIHIHPIIDRRAEPRRAAGAIRDPIGAGPAAGLARLPIGRLDLHPHHGGFDLFGCLSGAGGLRGIRVGLCRAGLFPALSAGGQQQGKDKGQEAHDKMIT